jgi:hypothetical protein
VNVERRRQAGDVRVAVLTLTRDRLAYTRHCFAKLHELAGCSFDHYVLDQASRDGTVDWLCGQTIFKGRLLMPENIGCCRGWNRLLTRCAADQYDVIVTFDNDCELIEPGTLATVAQLAAEHETILSPIICGLMHPPSTISQFQLGEYVIDEKRIIGNIFMAIPSPLLWRDGFRWDERHQVWDGGESITQWFRQRGGRCGYVQGFHVNHYKTTLGQVADMPWYFERRVKEGGRPQ